MQAASDEEGVVVAAAGCVALPLHAYIQIYFQAG